MVDEKNIRIGWIFIAVIVVLWFIDNISFFNVGQIFPKYDSREECWLGEIDKAPSDNAADAVIAACERLYDKYQKP